MYQHYFEQINPFIHNLATPFSQLSQITIEATESITRQNIDVANELFKICVQHTQNLMTVKCPEDMMNVQTHFISDFSNKCISHMQQLFEASQTITAECTKCMQNNMKTSAKASQEVVRKASK